MSVKITAAEPTPFELTTALVNARSEAKTAFQLAAGYDGISADAPFFVFSDENPYAEAYNDATLAVVVARSAANEKQASMGEAEFAREVLMGYQAARRA